MGVVIKLDKSARGTRLSESLVDAVESLPEGNYNIYIERRGYVRSVSQNKLFWMWMTQLEYWSGTPRKVWHDYYVAKFLPPGKKGTSGLSRDAMSHFMNQIQADTQTEWGMTLPSPDDIDTYNAFVGEFIFK